MKYKYFFTAHSLGQALSLLFKKDFPFIKSVAGWNGAYQPSDLMKQDDDVKKYYIDEDKLYKSGGYLFKKKTVFKYSPSRVKKFFDFLRRISVGNILDANLDAHKLENFDNTDLS